MFSGVQDQLNDLVDEIERRKLEAEEKRKQEEEEAAQKKFIGTRVTVESFLQWKEKFDAELEALKSQKQKELEAAMKVKLSIEFLNPQKDIKLSVVLCTGILSLFDTRWTLCFQFVTLI